jgi:hypothetical protein
MIRERDTFLLVLILVLVPIVWSQTQNDLVTLKGTVSETTFLSNNDLHVWLQGERAGSEVCLGPARFLNDQGLMPGVGDTIEVTGRRVGNGSLLVADSLQMRGKTLPLSRASATTGCHDCSGHDCGDHDCGGYHHHGCGHHHSGHCCDHE